MMEGNLIYILAFMGGLSLYIVIATAVGKAIYNQTSDLTEDERTFLSVFSGALFPITIPVIIIMLWITALINIPSSSKKEEEETTKRSFKSKEDEEYAKTKFKEGDLITGVKGNPGNYRIFYQGCVCRVLKTYPKDEDMRVILVDHVDKEAHETDFGKTRTVPWKNFTLIKQKKNIEKVAKKKGKK